MTDRTPAPAALLRLLLAVLVAVGLSVGALAIGHDDAGGAHHATPVVAVGDPMGSAGDGGAADPVGTVAEVCFAAMLCGAALLLFARRLLRSRPASGALAPALLERVLALTFPVPRAAFTTPDLTELSISRR